MTYNLDMLITHETDNHEIESTLPTGVAHNQTSSVTTHLGSIVCYAFLSIIATWPMAQVFTTQAVGEQYDDQVQNIWNLWWVKNALLNIHTNPFHTDLLFYPQGANLYFHTLNLPSTLITLPVLIALGKVAAYNFSLLFALTMSGYAAFRLVFYLTGSKAGALLGGIIIGFNPLSNYLIRAQVNVLSLQWMLLCIEFFLRAFSSGRRRDAILTGVFFSLAVLTVGYFEIHLLVFVCVFFLWALVTMPAIGIRARLGKIVQQIRPLVMWGGGAATIILLPYLVGAVGSLNQSQIILSSSLDSDRTVLNSADLLGFIIPNSQHWLLGSDAPWWTWIDPGPNKPAFHTYLGFVTIGLAAIGFMRAPTAVNVGFTRWLWCSLAIVGLVLCLGPTLAVNTQISANGMSIPLPFSVLQDIFPFSVVRAPERFIYLTYLSLGVLAAWGVDALVSRLRPIRQASMLTLIFILIILEMPLHARVTEPRDVPGSILALAHDPEPGAVLELPLTQHGRIDAPRMLFQTAHGRPITSGYISRAINDPYMQACSPFHVFTTYPNISANDIVTPSVSSQSWGALLEQNGIGFITVYKRGTTDAGLGLQPLPSGQVDALRALADRLGISIGDDEIATTYRLKPNNQPIGLFLQLGSGWNALEKSLGQPFRWMDGTEAELCVFSPSSIQQSMVLSATSYNTPRSLELWVDGTRIFKATVPADGLMHLYSTSPVTWPAKPTLVRLVTPDGSASPAQLGQSKDRRQLSLGFTQITLAQNGP